MTVNYQSKKSFIINLRHTFLSAALLVFSGCTSGPNYDAPTLPQNVSDTFNKSARETSALDEQAIQQWWRGFKDPTLTKLIDDGFERNYDIRIAAANAEIARSLAGLQRFDLYPTVTSSGAYQRTRQSGSTLGVDRTLPDTDAVSSGLNASWELDFWGRVRRSVQSATRDAQAAEALRRDAYVIVAADIGLAYVDMRGAQRQVDVAKRNTEIQRETLRLQQIFREEGRSNNLDVARAEAQYRTTRATIPAAEANAQNAAFRLSITTGRTPQELNHLLSEKTEFLKEPELLFLGDPSGLLRRRPDVRAAERTLAARTADIGIEVADLFPKVEILGNVGFSASETSDFGSGNSFTYGIGPSISWPAFNLGRVRARIKAAEAGAEGALATYESVVLTALQEAEVALNNYTQQKRIRADLAIAFERNKVAVETARLRYEQGADDFLNLLDSEARLLASEQTLTASEITILREVVNLYRALGGGWSIAAAKPQ